MRVKSVQGFSKFRGINLVRNTCSEWPLHFSVPARYFRAHPANYDVSGLQKHERNSAWRRELLIIKYLVSA
jgi:hypothetical protein